MQTATNIEQSRKLLSLGIDPETADMQWIVNDSSETLEVGGTKYGKVNGEYHTPAWSLSALIELLPEEMMDCDPDDRLSTYCLDINKCNGEWWVEYGSELRSSDPDLFTACINLLEKLVEQGCIKTKKKEQ